MASCSPGRQTRGRVVAFGIEGTGSYGIGLTRFLRRNGHTVHEVHRPPRKAERRLLGKSDTVDAEHAARQVLAGTATAVPKLGDGDIETLRLVKLARDTAVKAHSQAMITLKATLVTANDELRADLEPLTDYRLITACAAFPPAVDLADADTAMRHMLGSLARRWLALHDEIKVHSRHLKARTKKVAPRLIAAFGIGPDIAAELLVAAGDNTDMKVLTAVLREATMAVLAAALHHIGLRRFGIDARGHETLDDTYADPYDAYDAALVEMRATEVIAALDDGDVAILGARAAGGVMAVMGLLAVRKSAAEAATRRARERLQGLLEGDMRHDREFARVVAQRLLAIAQLRTYDAGVSSAQAGGDA